MKKFLILGVIIALAVTVSGCKNAAEKTAEKAIETSSGGSADVDIDDDSVKVETEDGTLEVGSNATLPDGFPSDVFVADGDILSSLKMDEQDSYQVSIETDDSVADVKEAYQENASSDGWTSTSTMDIGEATMMTWEKGDRSLSVSISNDDEMTTVIVTVTTVE